VNGITTRLATAESNLKSTRTALDKTSERLSLEQRRFELVRGRYQIGTTSESEFLDAQDDLTSAELDRSAVAVRLRLAEAEWLNAAGK
jgi:outer membrane protein TolC